MCDSFDGCDGCPGAANACCFHNDAVWCKNPNGVVAAVENWAKDHPVKTRQSEMLKIFPDARIDSGAIYLCPRYFLPEEARNAYCEKHETCEECRNDYWNEEVPDND